MHLDDGRVVCSAWLALIRSKCLHSELRIAAWDSVAEHSVAELVRCQLQHGTMPRIRKR